MLILAMLQEVSKAEPLPFEQFFHDFYRPVLALFAKRGCTPEECQDLAQETFLRAHRAFSGFRREAKLSTWLHTIATNVWINSIRDATAAKRDGDEVPIPEDGLADGTSGSAIQIRVLARERQELLRSAIDDLPAGMRRCVFLRVYQDMSYRDIADTLGITVQTAKSQYSRARAKLQSILAEHYPELGTGPDDKET